MKYKGNIRYVFASSNTCQGFHTFVPELISKLQNVFVLKGGPGTGKATFIRLLGEELADKGYEIEFWISSVDSMNPEGVFIPQLQAAIINGSGIQAIDPEYPGATGYFINLGEYTEVLPTYQEKQQVMELIDQFARHHQQAITHLQEAARVKENVSQANIRNMDQERLQGMAKKLLDDMIPDQPGEQHYFASAVTPEGIINYLDESSSRCSRRYILKGPAGWGASGLIAQLAQKACEKGYGVEYYHSGLDCNSLLMVVIPGLELAIIDADDIQLSIKPWDIVVDFSSYLEQYQKEPMELEYSEEWRTYESLLLAARDQLEQSRQILKRLKQSGSRRLDYPRLNQKREEVLQILLAALAEK